MLDITFSQIAVNLRAHHLLCILTHIGKGYTPAFTENMKALIQRINKGARINIMTGPDDICAPLQNDEAFKNCHCLTESTRQRDVTALNEISRILGIKLKAGETMRLEKAHIKKLRSVFLTDNTLRQTCRGCKWKSLCDDIARSGFKDCFLH